MSNAEPTPVSYFMQPKEQLRVMKELRQEGLAMVAIFHSHPQSPAYPSVKDISLAFYPEALYVIVGLMNREAPAIKAYSIIDGVVKETLFEITL
jgi:proteasome lid subunit RPN8/RPN11